MSDQQVIAAQVRERAGKGAARAARRAGMVPCVIYGAKKDPTIVTIERRNWCRRSRKVALPAACSTSTWGKWKGTGPAA